MLELYLKGASWWAVDKIILAYGAAACALIIGFYPHIPGAAVLLALHAVAVLLWALAVRNPSAWSSGFRHWYALPYVAACYKEAAILIPALGRPNRDQWLANLDLRIWGAHPTVWLERVSTPLVTEYLQIVYSLFVPAVLLVAALLWQRREYAKFRYYAFLTALGFLVSYIGYYLVPARGPRFLLADLQQAPLRGLWLFQPLQAILDRLESVHYDAFPSGHAELTIIAWWGSRLLSKRLFRAYSVYAVFLILATVYLRYHYVVDVLAGMLTAGMLIALSPALYRTLSPRGSDFGN